MWGDKQEALNGAAELARAGRWLLWTFVVVLAASAAQAECRVTGVVTSTELKGKTKAEPAARQFQMQVVESPWAWQVGVAMPVTSTVPVKVSVGDAVEVRCDFAKFTRKGRFVGAAAVRKVAN